MDTTHKLMCRAANRVSVQMEYLLGTTDAAKSRNLAEEAIEVTLDALTQIDPSTLQTWSESLLTTFGKIAKQLKPDDKWQTVVARNCDRLSEAGLRAKTIQVVGTVFSVWNLEQPTFTDLKDSLERFFQMLVHQKDHVCSILINDESEGESAAPAIYSLLNSSLAIIFAGINVALQKQESESVDAASAVAFGAALFIHCVTGLTQRVENSPISNSFS